MRVSSSSVCTQSVNCIAGFHYTIISSSNSDGLNTFNPGSSSSGFWCSQKSIVTDSASAYQTVSSGLSQAFFLLDMIATADNYHAIWRETMKVIIERMIKGRGLEWPRRIWKWKGCTRGRDKGMGLLWDRHLVPHGKKNPDDDTGWLFWSSFQAL